MDYVSNSVMMPLIALLSTVLIGWLMTPDYVIDEMERSGHENSAVKKALPHYDPLCRTCHDVRPDFYSQPVVLS